VDATNLESLAEKMFEGSDTDAPGAGEENLREAAEEMVEPTQDAESEIVEEVEEDEDVVEASDDDGESAEYDDATEYADEVEAVDEADSEPLYDVKVNGRMERRTLSELKQNYAGQSYIQQKMRENAEVAKQLEEREALSAQQLQEREALLAQQQQQVMSLHEQMQSGEMSPPTPPSKELFQDDPIGYMQAKLEYDDAKQAYDQKAAQVQQLSEHQKRQSQAQEQQYLQQQMQLLQERIPEFADPQKAEKVKADIFRGGQEYYGIPQEALATLKDAVEVEILNDAIKYRRMLANKTTAKAKVQDAKPMVKPGAKKVQNSQAVTRKKQYGKLRKSGDPNDAIELMIDSNLK